MTSSATLLLISIVLPFHHTRTATDQRFEKVRWNKALLAVCVLHAGPAGPVAVIHKHECLAGAHIELCIRLRQMILDTHDAGLRVSVLHRRGCGWQRRADL